MDTTYWGRDFGVVIFMDAHRHTILHFRFVSSKERIADYQEGITYLQHRGFIIEAVVSDGLPGIKEAFLGIPYQYCHFHQLLRIRQLLTNSPRLQASKELRDLARTLTYTTKDEFEKQLNEWQLKWSDFMAEKTYSIDGKYHFTHRRVRTAFFSLKRHLNELFTFEKYPQKHIPKTNNAIEALNAVLKMKLRLHRGIAKQNKQKLIAALLIGYNPLSQKHLET